MVHIPVISLNKDTRGIMAFGTDGEEELYKVMRISFPHAVHVRCFTHFRDNSKYFDLYHH